MGSDKFVFFTQELGQAANVAELEELARDSGRADTGGTGETVVARLDPASRVTEGESARLWVDTRKLHVFDPASGHNLTEGMADARQGRPLRPLRRLRQVQPARQAPRARPRRTPGAGRLPRGPIPPAERTPGRRTRQLIPAGYRPSLRGGRRLRLSSSMTSSFHSWVRISRYRSRAMPM